MVITAVNSAWNGRRVRNEGEGTEEKGSREGQRRRKRREGSEGTGERWERGERGGEKGRQEEERQDGEKEREEEQKRWWMNRGKGWEMKRGGVGNSIHLQQILCISILQRHWQ